MSARPSHIVAGLVLAAAAVGFFVGTRGTRKSTEARQEVLMARADGRDTTRVVAGATAATAWPDLPNRRRGPNAEWENHLGKVHGEVPPPEVAEGRDERLAATRIARAALRAYDGAPPRVPHAIDQRSTAACLACHGEGLVVVDRIAPKMSHPVYQNCTQCHVRDGETNIPPADFPAEQGLGRALPPINDFAGLAPVRGTRFLPDSPPVMPHSRMNRQDCQSCHGPLGDPGLRTTHPERLNCEQCHAPAPSLVQEVFFR